MISHGPSGGPWGRQWVLVSRWEFLSTSLASDRLMPVTAFSPGLAQEPSNVERFRENFQRNGLGEGFLFLKGCIKKVWVNTKSPKADSVGLQTWHRGTLGGGCHLPQHCLRAPERETACAKCQNWVKAGSQPWQWGEGQHPNSYLDGAAKHLPGVRHRAFLADSPQGHPLPER